MNLSGSAVKVSLGEGFDKDFLANGLLSVEIKLSPQGAAPPLCPCLLTSFLAALIPTVSSLAGCNYITLASSLLNHHQSNNRA